MLTTYLISLASKGDPEAVSLVMLHYNHYIMKLARRYGYLDVEAKCQIESKLLQALLKFRM